MVMLIPGDRLMQGVPVFFWQRYNNYIYQLGCLSLILVPIAIVLGLSSLPAGKNPEANRRSGHLAVLFLFFGLCLFANYSALFVLSSVTRIGTTNFKGHVYHLVRYDKYDDPSLFYFGKCDTSGYWCVFQEIYDTFQMDPGPPQITMSDDSRMILVKMGSETVYTYDGEKGHCIEDVLLVWCSEAPP